MSKSRAVGIDLGTTYSAVAWLQESGKSAMIANSDGDFLTPSVVLFDDREMIIGKEAKKLGPLKPTRFAECVKRDMGSPVYSRPICGDYMPPEVIQAWVLKKLKADIVRTLGPDFRAVITVPAFFDEPRRKATADAGNMAALPVLDVVNEPTAAALAFGEELGYLTSTGDVKKPLKVLVYDLGGGTFDVTILDMRPGDLRTLATDGDVRLGGRDWDQRLADHVAGAFIQEHREDPRTNPASLQRLMNEVEEAKRTLSARQNATVRVDHAGSTTTIKLSREQFEQLTADLLERTAYTTRQVLAVAGLTWADINRVLLVGGATRMPMVARMLQELSGLAPDRNVHPDEAVARGAAVYAGYLLATQPGSSVLPAFTVTNINSHSLGIEGIESGTSRKRNVIVIPRNTPLPAKVKERFVTKTENQRSIVVQVLEGESSTPSECTAIGRTSLRDLPLGLPAGWPVEITYEYETNGRLKVSAVVPGANREVTLQLEREGSLSEERMSRWKQAISGEGGMDIFADIIAEELKLSKSSAFAPVANAEHVASPAPQSAATPAAAPFRPIPVAPSASMPSGQPSPAAPYHPSPSPAAPLPGEIRPTAMQAAAAVPHTAATAAPMAVAAAPWPSPPSAAAYPHGPAAPNVDAAPSTPRKAPVRRRQSGGLVAVTGFALSAIIGLVLGYYILCYINPQGNFLHLPPKWFPWKIEAPVPPGAGNPPLSADDPPAAPPTS